MRARGAEVTITYDQITITRSELARNLLDNASIPASDLIGWGIRIPDDCSPGFIDLMHGGTLTRINFAAGQQQQFNQINGALTLLQAGYPLDIPAPQPSSASTTTNSATHRSSTTTASPASSAPKPTRASSSKRPWSKVATPDEVPETNTAADIDGPIFGHVVCVTGDVEPYSKGDVWNMIANAGGTVSKSVTKKTTMLIVGQWATMTSKEKRARQLQGQGQEIEIISFEDFLTQV